MYYNMPITIIVSPVRGRRSHEAAGLPDYGYFWGGRRKQRRTGAYHPGRLFTALITDDVTSGGNDEPERRSALYRLRQRIHDRGVAVQFPVSEMRVVGSHAPVRLGPDVHFFREGSGRYRERAPEKAQDGAHP